MQYSEYENLVRENPIEDGERKAPDKGSSGLAIGDREGRWIGANGVQCDEYLIQKLVSKA